MSMCCFWVVKGFKKAAIMQEQNPSFAACSSKDRCFLCSSLLQQFCNVFGCQDPPIGNDLLVDDQPRSLHDAVLCDFFRILHFDDGCFHADLLQCFICIGLQLLAVTAARPQNFDLHFHPLLSNELYRGVLFGHSLEKVLQLIQFFMIHGVFDPNAVFSAVHQATVLHHFHVIG